MYGLEHPHQTNFGYTDVYPNDIVVLMLAKDAGIRVRVERDLREAFAEACRAQGLAASEVLRDFMRAYAERHQSGLQRNPFLDTRRQREMAHGRLMAQMAKDEREAGLCSKCGQPADNGEGYDGLCGSCADRRENAHEENQANRG